MSEMSKVEGEIEAESRHVPFRPSLSKAKDVETAVSLLQSKEKTTLLAAVEALSKYASKSKDNLNVLRDLGVVNHIIPIIEHEDLFIRRFAAKLLTEMLALPDVTIYLIESDYLSHFAKLLANEKDTFMQEYFSAILAKLSKDPYGAALLGRHCTDMNFLFERVQSLDPDVTKNSMEILHNLMQDLVAARKISKTEKSNFSLLCRHFESPYPEIQYLALDVLADVIARNKNEDIQSLFREINGVKTLVKFLENGESSNLHAKVLRLLHLAAENSEVVDELIDSKSIRKILNYVKRVANTELSAEAFRIIVNVANTSSGRKVLHSYGIIKYLTNALRSTRSDIIETICHGIGKMAIFNPAAQELARKELVETILDLWKREDFQWCTRHAAGFALKQLLMSDVRNCNSFLNIRGQDYLLQLVKQFVERVPVETCVIALEALLAITRHLTLRDTLINLDTFDTICLLLEESTYPFVDEFKIACCNLLSVLCLEKDGRRYFLEAKGPQRSRALITDAHSISVRNAAVQLVQIITTDLTLASAFIENNYLSYMLNNHSLSRVIPSWETCTETLLKSHLPIKFAIMGRLSLRDLTRDGFYVLRRTVCPFPVLDDIFRFKFSPLESVYVVNCTRSSTPTSTSQIALEENVDTRFELKFGRLQCDPHLIEYVELFKSTILATEAGKVESTNVQYVLSRAKMLALFVARQMSGIDPEIPIDQQLEVHLKEIKERLETNVIPLGQLRVGSYLERALLFKAIADRICLPAALVRGENGLSWIEIAVPQIEELKKERSFSAYLDENDKNRKIDRSMIYSVKLIRPNFIVDLMDIPGDLIPIGSPRSRCFV